MDDKKREIEELNDLKKYNHYAQENDGDADAPNEYEDISSFTEGNGDFYSQYFGGEDENTVNEEQGVQKNVSEPRKKEKGFFKKNHYRNTKIIALCLAIFMLLGASGALVWVYVATKSEGYNNNGIDIPDNIDDNYLVDDDHQFEPMGDIDADSLNGFLKEWACNGGEKMYNKNVINVLLCGVDSVYNLCDAQILVSVNKKTEEIKMISFLRDSWTYIKMPRSDGQTYDYYNKVNAAYHGGPATLMQTIENNYKIEIDQYIVVDFESFPKVIDALGGVTVDVQQYESDYIRRTSKQTDFPVGVSKLNGKQALIYSRIRKSDLDNDLSRTRRQRSVIKGLIESAKTATKGQLVNAFKQVSGYLRTGYSQSEVISLIAQAYAHNWMGFEIKEITMPDEDYVERIGGYIGTAWAWTVDYPLCAQRLQQELYGETNIVLSNDRTSALDFVSNKKVTNSSGSSSSSSSGSSYVSSQTTASYYGYKSTTYDYDLTEHTSSNDYEDDEVDTTSKRFTLPTYIKPTETPPEEEKTQSGEPDAESEQ